jgi:hypothetical protein
MLRWSLIDALHVGSAPGEPGSRQGSVRAQVTLHLEMYARLY